MFNDAKLLTLLLLLPRFKLPDGLYLSIHFAQNISLDRTNGMKMDYIQTHNSPKYILQYHSIKASFEKYFSLKNTNLKAETQFGELDKVISRLKFK